MSDSALPKIFTYGTHAARLAFTPSPAAGVNQIYIWYETDTDLEYHYTTTWEGPFVRGTTAVTPGSYTNTNLTVDAYGRLTAASNGSAGAAGAWTNITGSVTVTGATVSGGVASVVTPGTTVSFSSIPGTYNHLVMEIVARVSDAALVENFFITFNSDTGANYDKQIMTANSTTLAGSGTAAASNLLFGYLPGSTATANVPGQNQLRINNYSGTTFFKMADMLSEVFETTGTTSTYRTGLFSGMWRSTAAITRIDLVDGGGGNFIAGSAFSLYGIT